MRKIKSLPQVAWLQRTGNHSIRQKSISVTTSLCLRPKFSPECPAGWTSLVFVGLHAIQPNLRACIISMRWYRRTWARRGKVEAKSIKSNLPTSRNCTAQFLFSFPQRYNLHRKAALFLDVIPSSAHIFVGRYPCWLRPIKCK